MTTPRRFEDDLTALLADLYQTGVPDYRDDIVRRTARMRQRPAWMFPGRWLPVDITTQAAPAARMPWRQLGVLALIGVLIALIAVAYVGSQRQQPAPPFGPAANGDVIYSADGDIVVADPETNAVTAVVSGPEVDTDAAYSPDGTRIGFRRSADGPGGPALIMVAAPDGSGLVQVTTEPLTDLMQWSFSPDGREVLAVASVDGRPSILFLPVDGSSAPRIFGEIGLPSDVEEIEAVSFRPPDGATILVMTMPAAGPTNRGIKAFDVATGGLRTIVEATYQYDIFGAGWSPDGANITYQRYEPVGGVRAHIVDADGQNDRLVDPASTAAFDFVEAWSNEGTHVLLRSRAVEGAADRLAVLSSDGSGPRVDVRCGGEEGSCPGDLTWSPDDSTMIGAVTANDAVVGYVQVDPTTGRMTDLPWSGDAAPSWQRVAP